MYSDIVVKFYINIFIGKLFLSLLLLLLFLAKVPQQCDQTISDNDARITSPGYPGRFGPNYRCIYTVFRPDPSVCQLELDFLSFSLGRHNPSGCTSGAFLELPGRTRLCHEFNGKSNFVVAIFSNSWITLSKISYIRWNQYVK